MTEETAREEIMAIAQTLTGADGEEQELLALLEKAQERILQNALRAGKRAEDCGDAYLCAAGMLTAAALEAVRAGGEEISSLRAGDMAITRQTAQERTERIKLLREEAWEMMRPYTKEGNFYFCRTRK